MGFLSENITIVLFGLEKDLWDRTDESEQSSYNTAMFCFVFFYLLSLISSSYLIYMITVNFWTALPAGFLVSLIIGSVVRFSLIILRRSIFDLQTEKPEPVIQTQSSTPPTAVNKSWKSKFKGLRLKWPNSHSKVPGFAGAIRLIIMTVMGLLVLFPLACIFHQSSIEKLNQQSREMYVTQFEEDGKKSLETKVSLIQKEINSIKEDLEINGNTYQTDGLIKEKKAAIVRLTNLLEKETKEHSENQAQQLLYFKQAIEGQFFLALSFTSVIEMPFFKICLIILGLLLFLPHFFLYRLKKQSGETYSKRSTDYYRSIIDKEYEKTTKEGYALLKNKFNYDPKGYHRHVYWENPPYCTIPHQPFSKKVPVTRDAFLKSFETKGTA